MLKKGDKVVMHTLKEAGKHLGKIWVCESQEFTIKKGLNVVNLAGYPKPFKVKYLAPVEIPAGVPIIPTREEIRDWIGNLELFHDIDSMIHQAFCHFLSNGNTCKVETVQMTYFDGKLSLTLPLPPDMKINYISNEAFVERLHKLLAEAGVGPRANFQVYFPTLVKIVQECDERQIPIQTFEGGFNYSGSSINITFKAY